MGGWLDLPGQESHVPHPPSLAPLPFSALTGSRRSSGVWLSWTPDGHWIEPPPQTNPLPLRPSLPAAFVSLEAAPAFLPPGTEKWGGECARRDGKEKDREANRQGRKTNENGRSWRRDTDAAARPRGARSRAALTPKQMRNPCSGLVPCSGRSHPWSGCE